MTVIAIDGPAGAGKSTVARAVADELGYTYVDTGAMYRAVALAAMQSGVPPREGAELEALLGRTAIELEGRKVVLDGEDVTHAIRSDVVTEAVSRYSALAPVRRHLVELQRASAGSGDVVMEGRDIGTAVWPAAEVKVYLTADLAERARRRSGEFGADGSSLNSIEASLAARDAADSERSVSPLQVASDATTIDTTGLAIEEVVAAVLALVPEA